MHSPPKHLGAGYSSAALHLPRVIANIASLTGPRSAEDLEPVRDGLTEGRTHVNVGWGPRLNKKKGMSYVPALVALCLLTEDTV